MNQIRIGIVLFLGVIYLASCTKDNSGQAGSTLELVTNTKWKLDAIYLTDSPYVLRSNFTTQNYADCELSDIYQFQKDSILSRKRANPTTPCTPLSAVMPDDGASWHLDSADTYLVIEKPSFLNGYRYNGKILKLDKHTMELQSNFRNYFNQPSAYIFSFKATQ